MSNKLRQELINELSDLSLSLSDSLERVGETELESNQHQPDHPKDIPNSNDTSQELL